MSTMGVIACGAAVIGLLYAVRHWKAWLAVLAILAVSSFFSAVSTKGLVGAALGSLFSVLSILALYGCCRLLWSLFISPLGSQPHPGDSTRNRMQDQHNADMSALLQRQHRDRF